MKNSSRRNLQYRKLWKDAGLQTQGKQIAKVDKDCELIDDVCFRADLCESAEDYVRTLCEGMIFLLQANVPLKSIQKHSVLVQKVFSIPDDLLNSAHQNSDLYYIGLFAKVRLQFDWLKIKFYQVIQKMLQHVLDHFSQLSRPIKNKILEQLKRFHPEFYRSLFPPLKVS